MKKIFKVIIVSICVIFIVSAGGFFYIKSKDLPTINVSNVDIKNVSDGSYIGEYNTSLVKARVKVNIKNNKIKSIDIIEHKCGLGKKAEKVTKEIEKNAIFRCRFS